MPPLRATLVLITTCSAAAATIFLVHRQQTVDRERMHRGVLRDEAIDAAGKRIEHFIVEKEAEILEV